MHPAETSTIAHGTHNWWGSFPTDREDLRLGHLESLSQCGLW